MEEKTFPFELKDIDEKGVFEGYAAIFEKPDAMNEIVEKGAFIRSIKAQKQFPLLWYHNPENPIGIISEIEEDEKGLKVKGELNLEVQAAREKYALMKQKAIRGLSFGFNTLKDLWDGPFRRLKEVKLFEVSPVTFQAHPKALILNVKNAKFKTVGDALELLESTTTALGEFEGDEIKSNVNKEIINNAIKALETLLGVTDPSKDTQNEKKGIIPESIGKLGQDENPQPHFQYLENPEIQKGEI